MVSNSLTLIGVSVYWQNVFIGLIIVCGASISAIQAKRSLKASKERGKEAA